MLTHTRADMGLSLGSRCPIWLLWWSGTCAITVPPSECHLCSSKKMPSGSESVEDTAVQNCFCTVLFSTENVILPQLSNPLFTKHQQSRCKTRPYLETDRTFHDNK